jgi:hypothetical protein
MVKTMVAYGPIIDGATALLLVNIQTIMYSSLVNSLKHTNTIFCVPLQVRRQLEHWKEQAGLSPEQRRYVDMEEIGNERHGMEDA